jgi:phosphomannomutase
MLNISPIGRNCSREERNAYETFDLVSLFAFFVLLYFQFSFANYYIFQANNIRKTMVEIMRDKFAHLNLTFSIGGQISFDMFPTGFFFSALIVYYS